MSDMVPVRPKKKIIAETRPVVRTLKHKEPQEDEYTDWNESNNKQPRKMGCALWFVGLICLLFLALVIGGLIATAQINLHPKKITGPLDVSVNLSQEGGQGTLRFYSATKTFTDERIVPIQATASKDAYAIGTIRFYNTNAEVKTIAAKTLVKSTNAGGQVINYRTKGVQSIPKANNKKPGQKDVEVVAESVGSGANIGLSDFILATAIPGVTARSVTEMKGGSSVTDKIGDPALVAAAHDELMTSFAPSIDLVNRMTQEVPNTMLVLPITFVDSAPVFSVEPNHDDGVHVIAHKAVAITMVNRTEFARFIAARLGTAKDLVVTIPNLDGLTITTATLASPKNIPRIVPIRITGDPVIYGQIADDEIKAGILGKSRSETRMYLADIKEIDQYDIHIMPFWRRILPLDSKKISVTVTNP